MKHEHSEIFAALRAEWHLELDGEMASYIAEEPRARSFDGAESAKGRAFAAAIARTHGVEGVRSLYRCLNPGHSLLGEGDIVMDAAISKQLEGRHPGFRLGANVFCEQSGVV
jgi:hypothetical protein